MNLIFERERKGRIVRGMCELVQRGRVKQQVSDMQATVWLACRRSALAGR